jgi:triosephosphate isomerase (TIM)
MAALPRPVLAGNWKMHKDPAETREFFGAFLEQYAPRDDRSVIFFPPALSIAAAADALRGRDDVALGVQNIYWEAHGAFTGEISAPLVRGTGAAYALVGHSERRHVFGETIEETARKVRAALDAGIVPVLCVGEQIEERRAGRAESVVAEQLDGACTPLSEEDVDRILIAYEPVWAIGTGETASPADAEAMHGFIRRRIAGRFGEAFAAGVPLLYGGSVKPENAAELLAAGDVDGVLVGGASLDASGFARICGASY